MFSNLSNLTLKRRVRRPSISTLDFSVLSSLTFTTFLFFIRDPPRFEIRTNVGGRRSSRKVSSRLQEILTLALLLLIFIFPFLSPPPNNRAYPIISIFRKIERRDRVKVKRVPASRIKKSSHPRSIDKNRSRHCLEIGSSISRSTLALRILS